MRILYMTYDGILDPVCQSQVLPYLESLSRAGNLFTLLSFEKKERLREGNAKATHYDRLRKSGICWRQLVYHKNPSIPATIFDAFNGIVNSYLLIKRNGITAIHARGYISMLMAYILKKISGIKVIFDMRGFWAEEKVDAGARRRGGILYRIIKRMEKAFLASSDEIVVLTNAAKRHILETAHPKAPIAVIPCCTDLNLFKRSKSETLSRDRGLSGKAIILYAGSLGSFYNLDKILDFFLFFKTRNPSAFLRVISHYPKKAMDAAALSHSIKKMWYSLEALDYEKMPEAFSGADFSVILYNRRLSGLGCSPIKFAESLACGTPVIINSGIGDCDDIVAQNNIGAVLKNFSSEEYERVSDKMLELLSKRGDTTSRCVEAAKKIFSLEAGIQAYHNIYERLA